MVFVGAIDGHFASTVSVERLRRLNPAMAPRLKQLSFLQPMASIVSELQDLSPTSLATYPSVALLLAHEQRQGRLAIRPREIWTGGEGLTPAMRSEIGQAFQCPVINNYGSSEFLSLAFECRHGRLHVNSDWAILESVDEAGRPAPAGQPGATCLLTNLANHVQPIIRYDIGDSVTLHDTPCECGSALPVIEVAGRDEGMLHLGDQASRTVSLTPLALSTVLESQAGLYDFQLVQQGPAHLLLGTSRQGREAQEALGRARDVLGDFLAQQGASGIRIDCQCGEVQQRGRSGKAKRVIPLTA
jgi:phenylacetate-coenzyme A ligase PaaK-like adenylate-forming protein